MNGIRECRRSAAVLLVIVITLAIGSVGASERGAVGRDSGAADEGFTVDWAELFSRDGGLRPRSEAPVLGVVDTVLAEDRLSGGAVEDISVIRHASDPADSLVVHGAVAAPHDVGNAYVVARLEDTDLVFDIVVERLMGDAEAETFLEIEFNRDVVAVSSGHRFPVFDEEGYMLPGHELRWPFRGERTDGDLLVRVDLRGRLIRSAEFSAWDDATSSYRILESDENFDDEACFAIATLYTVCSGSVDSYIANGDPEQEYLPDSYIDVSVNVSRLLGSNPDFTTVQVRSPHDIAFGSFSAFGRFAKPSSPVPPSNPPGLRLQWKGAGDAR